MWIVGLTTDFTTVVYAAGLLPRTGSTAAFGKLSCALKLDVGVNRILFVPTILLYACYLRPLPLRSEFFLKASNWLYQAIPAWSPVNPELLSLRLACFLNDVIIHLY